MKVGNTYVPTAKITKEYLQSLGVEHVSEDGKTIIYKGKEAKIFKSSSGKNKYYLNVRFYDPALREAVPVEDRNGSTGQFRMGVHVLNYIWQHNETTRGLDVHHIDNDPFNNHISNLALKTRRENLAADRDDWYKTEIKCDLTKPRSHFENKLLGYLMAYEQAKKDKDDKATHRLRGNISQTRARLRYYDSHLDEAKALQEAMVNDVTKKREYHERADKRKELQARVDSARKYYLTLREVYGKEDSIVYQAWGDWKMAIAELSVFKEENKKAS
jgi:hypothetical protein